MSDYVFKFLTLGNSSVGKTSVLLRITEETIPKSMISTLGIDFKIKELNLASGKKVKLILYDTAGQEKFRHMTKSYYNKVNVILLVYDVTRADSFKSLSYWIEEVSERVDSKNPEFDIVIIGNKCDLVDKRAVSKQEAQSFADKYNMNYIEVSAWTGEGFDELFKFFEIFANKIITFRESTDSSIQSSSEILLEKTPVSKKKVKCC